MTKASFYNEFGTKESRIVSIQMINTVDEQAARTKAFRIAAAWNRNEKRDNMRVNFIVINGALSAV
jgi:hypothetical protein